MRSRWIKRAENFIQQHAGEQISPRIAVPCNSTVVHNWSGLCAVSDEDLWLANSLGARRAPLDLIDLLDISGNKNLPIYVFAFQGSQNRFTVEPVNTSAALLLHSHLAPVFGLTAEADARRMIGA